MNILLETNILSFPGLGIGEFEINKTAFSLFGRDVAWYGIIVTLAIISVCAVVYYKAKKTEISTDDILDYFIYCIIFGIIGTRLYYVIFDGIGNYIVSDRGVWGNITGTLYNIVAVWEGGLAIYGGIISVALTIAVVSKIKHISFLKILDMGGHAALLGQAIGRWGNFFNAEAHGGETTVFCRMGIKNSLGVTHYYHPTFLYESLWNITGFLLICLLHKKVRRKYDGQTFLWYVTWYGLGRMFIEGLRTDSLYIGNTGIRVSQLLAFCLFIGGAVTLSVMRFMIIKKNSRAVTADTDVADSVESADGVECSVDNAEVSTDSVGEADIKSGGQDDERGDN